MENSVDIILPTCRRPHTIAYSIQSVLAQTYPAFSLRVIGDGCDETTESVVGSFHDPRVSFHRFPKGKGMGYRNRNQVLRQLSAPYVAYANDDDLWFPDHLERGVRALHDRHLSLIAFRSCAVRFPDIVDPRFFAFDWQMRFVSPLLRRWFTGSATLVHRRSVFERIGYWTDTLIRFGDREFYNRARTSGLPCEDDDCITVLRFYAQHWDARYTRLEEPPQKRYLSRLEDPNWRAWVRDSATRGPRTVAVRARQLHDFALFAAFSGPKFLRFWYQQMTAGNTGG